MTKFFKYIIPIFLIFLFLFLRFYKIKDSLFFFNDMGRDMVVLQNWEKTGKPPLLGPQTSVLPFNQSPIYFYLLYPVFLLSNQSQYTALVVNAILYICSFLFCLFLVSKYSTLISKKIIYFTFFLISIHPQYIIQSRYIWNPSFVTPFLLPSLLAFCLLIKKYSRLALWTLSFGLAMAISLSYSIAPLFIALALLSIFLLKKRLVPTTLSLIFSLFIVNLPLIFFELRHRFLLTTSLLSKHSPPQTDINFQSKLNNLLNFGINTTSYYLNLLIFILIIIISIYFIFKSKSSFRRIISILILLTLIITFIVPVTVQAHYIFGILILLFLLLASIPIRYSILPLMFFSFTYLSPKRLNTYFQKAPRTYSQMTSCFQPLCQKYQDSIFVSVQSSYHPYHNGPEHRYLLKKSGCDVQEIEADNNQASKMALVVDGGNFDPQKTKFYELDLLGPAKIIDTFSCQENFKVLILDKNATQK